MTIEISKLGLITAAALAGSIATLALSGFQANTAPKFATVDVEKVFNESKMRETNQKTLSDAESSRLTILQFIAANGPMDNKDAQKFAELSVKSPLTPAETAEIARLKAAGEEATRKNRELQTKGQLTDAEKASLSAYASNVQGKQAVIGRLQQDFVQQVQDMQNTFRDQTTDKVTEAIKNIAAKQGYTIVFARSAAPYAANDLTTEASKALK